MHFSPKKKWTQEYQKNERIILEGLVAVDYGVVRAVLL